MSFARLPPHGAGQRIGIFGGSFNPPHQGHRAASLLALRRLRLDWIWWLVTPGNPLKDARDLAPFPARLAAARKVASHPRIIVSSIEAEIGTKYTFETLSTLKARGRGVHFVWLMGADNFLSFHRWQRWRDIADLVPIAVIDRPGATLKAPHSRAAQALAPFRLPEARAACLAVSAAPAYVFLHGPRSAMSSTALRANAKTSAAPGQGTGAQGTGMQEKSCATASLRG